MSYVLNSYLLTYLHSLHPLVKSDLVYCVYNMVHRPPATSSARSATGCVVHGLGFLPTTSPTRDVETRRIDGSVHVTVFIGHISEHHCLMTITVAWDNRL